MLFSTLTLKVFLDHRPREEVSRLVSAKTNGATPLILSCRNGHHDVVRTLLSKGAAVDAEDENSCTPLMFAAMGNHPHSVKELLAHGANITRENIAGQTALSLAVRERATLAQTVLENHVASLLQTLVGRQATEISD